MSQLISILEGNAIHDASSVHSLTLNASTYTLQFGYPGSIHATTSEVTLPSDVMIRSVDASALSFVKHFHDVSVIGKTNGDGQLTFTGSVSKPSITTNNTLSTISYISNCSASITSTSNAEGSNVISNWTYANDTETLHFSKAILGISFSKNASLLTALTDTAPELSEAPVFTGQALPAHTHTFTVKTYTSKDIEPNQILYSTTDGQPINVAAKMTALGADSLTYANVNPVMSNEFVDGSTYLLTCAKPITLVGSKYNASNNLEECGPIFGYVGTTAETQNINLASMTLPCTTATLGNQAVSNCSALTDIGYIGSEDGWNDIAKNSSWNVGTNDVKITVETGEEIVVIPNNKIIYTSTDGNIVIPQVKYLGTNIISNTYENGKGVMIFDGDVSILNGTTFYGVGAFGQCQTLSSIILPESVTMIGISAFSRCTSLTNIIIPNSVTTIGTHAFALSGITDIIIPNSVTSIGNNTFYICNSLTSCTIGNSVTSIGNDAFNSCSGLTSITIPNSVTSIGNDAFNDCTGLSNIIIGNSVTTIGDRAFQNCVSLTSVTIPNSVSSICNEAFYNCTNLSNIIIGNSVTIIGDNTFNNCSSLTSIIIPDSVTSIGNRAFYNCTGLMSINIPNSVMSIGDGAFRECTNLTSIIMPNSVTSISNSVFFNCFSLMSITIPNTVTSIGSNAFYSCRKLTSIIIPDSVTSIGNSAFYGCSSLSNVIIGNSVTTIGDSAFFYCSMLTSIIIGNSVANIGNEVFRYCSCLTSITSLNTTPPTLGSNVLLNVSVSCPIYVPTESVSAYKSASGWSERAAQIQAMPTV